MINKRDKIMTVFVVLFISILINIYSICKINNYKYRIGQQSYIEIENIRQKNESNMNILNQSIENRNIKNEELLKLHKNYECISDSIIQLWQEYCDYHSETFSLAKKQISTSSVIENDVHGKIKEYTLSSLRCEMENEKTKLVLENEDLLCFEEMASMAEGIYNYFNEFNLEKLNGDSGDSKKKKIINKGYWIDMLNDINNITEEYLDTAWNIQAIEQE